MGSPITEWLTQHFQRASGRHSMSTTLIPASIRFVATFCTYPQVTRITVTSSRQIYIGMSTQLGKTAIDGVDGMGSPFARAFAIRMTTPGLRIDDAFRALREEVSQKTDGKQKPEILQDDLQQGALVLVRSP
jgi:hypothetical protein